MSGSCRFCDGTVFENVGLCSDCVALLEEQNFNSLQQLKAEIRLLLTEIEYDERGVGQITKGAIARKLRKLSAV